MTRRLNRRRRWCCTVRPVHASAQQRQVVSDSHVEAVPDPPLEPDMNRRRGIRAFDGILVPPHAGRGDLWVSGGVYLRHEADNQDEQLAPGCMVAFGVGPDAIEARNDYVTDEVGTSSESRHDYTVKRGAHIGYGVPADFGIPNQGAGRRPQGTIGLQQSPGATSVHPLR